MFQHVISMWVCKQFEHVSSYVLCLLRALDSELRSHIRGNDPMFEISKLAFFAEATGAVQESHLLEAQNNVANARKTSLQAGFALFKTSLSNDQVLHDRFLAASKTDEARARSAALASLEAVVWFIVSFVCLILILILILFVWFWFDSDFDFDFYHYLVCHDAAKRNTKHKNKFCHMFSDFLTPGRKCIQLHGTWCRTMPPKACQLGMLLRRKAWNFHPLHVRLE